MKDMQQAEVFPWSEQFSIGIPAVDAQHKRLVHLLNRLACHLVFGSDAPAAHSALAELTAYVSYHFQTEEAIWAEHVEGDALALEHHRIHEEIKAHLEELPRQASGDPERIFQDLLVFLTRWLAVHILQCDRHLAVVVRGLEAGLPLDEAKAHADREIDGTAAVMADVLITLYDRFSLNSATLIHEIDLRRRANEDLFDSTAQLLAIIDSTADLIWSVETDGFALKVFNRAVSDYFLQGYGLRLAPGMTPEDIYQGTALTRRWREFYEQALRNGPFSTEYQTLSGGRHLQLSFTPLQRDGKPFGVAVFGKDLTEHKAAEASIHQLAFYDPLTNLPNRRLLQDRLLQAIAGSRRSRSHSALLVCDLDNLKLLNDTRGHAAGDQVILE
ncbi:MAG TPA: hemerythrin domain-containing protein, partial [Holophaga sp.]|nr:hemerythrin domain-containing protein [Holophaga sp.]